MPRAFSSMLRRSFIGKWLKPTPHEAGQALSRAAAEKRERDRLTMEERKAALHAQLMAERETPLWQMQAGRR